jgi:hypothetical protein
MGGVELVDSHAHLQAEPFAADGAQAVAAARLAGVARILVPGWDLASSRAATELAGAHRLQAAAGIHPHVASKSGQEWPAVAELAQDVLVAAVGETGLDYDRGFSPREDQLANLRRHLAVGRELGKPVIGSNQASLWNCLRLAGIKDRMNGFGGAHRRPVRAIGEARDFPEFTASREGRGSSILSRPACDGPVSWRDFDAVKRDVGNLKAALERAGGGEGFMTAASPGVVPLFLGNDYYPNEDEFKVALAEVLKDEYEAIVDAGLVLQIDCPDLAMGRHFVEMTTEELRAHVGAKVERVKAA